MPEIVASPLIAGVHLVHLDAVSDARGQFQEVFRKAWFPERSWSNIQLNCSRSYAGVLRGLHYHHRQADYWYVVQGSIRVGLVDLRRDSSTRGVAQAVEIGDTNSLGLFVPIGVAHGFLALTDVVLTYVVDNYYDTSDEFGVAWDDPALGLDWGLGGSQPLVSARDQNNPRLAEIDLHRLPRWSG